jgi:hypothetical protein
MIPSISACGGGPSGLFSADFTIVMNFMGLAPSLTGTRPAKRGRFGALPFHDERARPISTRFGEFLEDAGSIIQSEPS